MGARHTKKTVKGDERLIQIGSSLDEKPQMEDKGQRLYKTEICRNYEELKSCRYGQKCRYAHGKEELRSVERHPRYKTIFCRTYQATGECPYGIRCTFLHKVTTADLPPSPPPEQALDTTHASSPDAAPNDLAYDPTTTNSVSAIVWTSALPSPTLLIPVRTPPGLTIPPLSPLPEAFLTTPCPLLCSSFTTPLDHQPSEPSFYSIDKYHLELQRQQLIKAAFYSQKNKIPALLKQRLARPLNHSGEGRRAIHH